MPRGLALLVCPHGQWLCPTGDQGDSEGQATAWALADMSSMVTGPSACLLTRAWGSGGGNPKVILEMLALLRKSSWKQLCSSAFPNPATAPVLIH